MKNITLSAPEELIEAARQQASRKGSTLNEEFRKWLALLERQEKLDRVKRYQKLTQSLKRVKTGGPFTREEMNER